MKVNNRLVPKVSNRTSPIDELKRLQKDEYINEFVKVHINNNEINVEVIKFGEELVGILEGIVFLIIYAKTKDKTLSMKLTCKGKECKRLERALSNIKNNINNCSDLDALINLIRTEFGSLIEPLPTLPVFVERFISFEQER